MNVQDLREPVSGHPRLEVPRTAPSAPLTGRVGSTYIQELENEWTAEASIPGSLQHRRGLRTKSE